MIARFVKKKLKDKFFNWLKLLLSAGIERIERGKTPKSEHNDDDCDEVDNNDDDEEDSIVDTTTQEIYDWV